MTRSKTVYVIDDERMDRKYAKRILDKSQLFGGVELFEGPEAALAHIQDGGARPDLIFLDINMMPITGFEFLEMYGSRIRELDPVPAVVIVSTTVNPADLERAAKFPLIRNFLCKPLTLEQVADSAALLEGPGGCH